MIPDEQQIDEMIHETVNAFVIYETGRTNDLYAKGQFNDGDLLFKSVLRFVNELCRAGRLAVKYHNTAEEFNAELNRLKREHNERISGIDFDRPPRRFTPPPKHPWWENLPKLQANRDGYRDTGRDEEADPTSGRDGAT